MTPESTARIKFTLLKEGLSPRKYTDAFWLECFAACKKLEYKSESSYDSLKYKIFAHWMDRTDNDALVEAIRDSKAEAPAAKSTVNAATIIDFQSVLAT